MRKNRFTKIFAVLCAVMMLASCSSTSDTDETTLNPQATTQPSGPSVITPDFRLGYNEQDSLNPFKTESAANCAVIKLMFDSLFVCNNSFEAVPLMAGEYEKDGKTITVKLKQGLVFSDGSAVTSRDVAYSFSLAKSSSLYSSRLSGFDYYTTVEDDHTIKFFVSSDNPYIIACLDFPVIKSDSSVSPIGSGRYRYATEISYGKFLLRNPKYTLGENSGFEAIELYDMGTVDTVAYKVQNGDFDFAYDNLSSGKVPVMSTSHTAVPLNNMVFIGMNSDSEFLKIQAIRNAISSAFDAKSVTSSVYGEFAKPSTLPFHPDWYAGDKSYNFESKTPLEYMSTIGYNQINSEGLITNGYYTISLNLIVNEENEQKVKLAHEIASSITASGININVIKYSFKEYISALQNKNYDLYLGEIRLTNDMNLSELFGGYVYYQTTNDYGIARENASRDAYDKFLAGEISFSEFCDIFKQSCPFVPVCFRNGVALFSRSLAGTGAMFAGDIFHTLPEWSMPN